MQCLPLSVFDGESFICTKDEDLPLRNDETEPCVVEIPLSKGFLILLGVCCPHSGTNPNFIEALGIFSDHSEFLIS